MNFPRIKEHLAKKTKMFLIDYVAVNFWRGRSVALVVLGSLLVLLALAVVFLLVVIFLLLVLRLVSRLGGQASAHVSAPPGLAG